MKSRTKCNNRVKVVMINNTFDQPFSVEAFEEKYKFRPSITGVCVWKACFGDGSDNIKGALQSKSLKQANSIKTLAFEFIKYLGDNDDITVDDLLKKESSTFLKNNTSIEDKFFNGIMSFDPKYEVDRTFFHNLKVIKSRCDSYKEFASSKEEDEKYNNLIEKILGFKVESEKHFKFGLIKG